MMPPEAHPQMLVLAELVRDERWHPRQKLRSHAVGELATRYRDGGPEALPPVLAGRIPGVEGLALIDGWYRAAAAEEAGLAHLPGLIRDYADWWEAYAEAVRIANTGPQSLGLGEKGRNIDAFLLQFPDAGPTELARRLGVTREYVWKRKKQMRERSTSADPLAKRAELLLKAWAGLWEAGLPEPVPCPDERLAQVTRAVAAAARHRLGVEAGVWVQRLEEAAYETWLLVAQPEVTAGAGRSRAGLAAASIRANR